MTEAEWDAGDSPYKMSLAVVRGSVRKLRLFAVACARRVPSELINEDCRNLLDASERSADGGITPKERRRLEQPVIQLAQTLETAWREALHRDDFQNIDYRTYKALSACAMTSQAERYMVRRTADEAADATGDLEAEHREQCRLLREIYGNPFRPTTFDARWRTADVVGRAEAIYADKAFDRTPILADALMDAGCEDEAILGHCRSAGPHVRGCWVLDLVRGKE